MAYSLVFRVSCSAQYKRISDLHDPLDGSPVARGKLRKINSFTILSKWQVNISISLKMTGEHLTAGNLL
jgi:hypothetical protein